MMRLFRLIEYNLMEDVIVRQFFQRHGERVRLYLPVQNLVTGPNPVSPFADPDSEDAAAADLPDLYPMNSLAKLAKVRIYRHENNFPILDYQRHSAPNAVLAVATTYAQEERFTEERIAGEALSRSLALAIGQARVKYGADVRGDLPEPVTVQFVFTTGDRFHFSVFQLNTMDLDSETGRKNYFWHEKETAKLFDVCEFVEAKPVLEGFNPDVFRKIAAMYVQGLNI